MKKSILTFACLALIALLCINISASIMGNDSLHITKLETRMLEAQDKAVIKIYHDQYSGRSDKEINFEKIIYDDYSYYIVSQLLESESFEAFKFAQGEKEKYKLIEYYPDKAIQYIRQNCTKGSEIIRSLGINASVEEVYCFDAGDYNLGLYLYYVTDKGDFVTFRRDKYKEKAYVMPVEEFNKLSAAYYNELEKLPKDTYGDSIDDLTAFYDLKKYEVIPGAVVEPDMTLPMIIGAAAGIAIMAVVCIIIVIVVKSKKNKRSSEKN